MEQVKKTGAPTRAPTCSGEDDWHLIYKKRRLYVRNEQRVFVPVGWICPRCKKVELEEGLMLPLPY